MPGIRTQIVENLANSLEIDAAVNSRSVAINRSRIRENSVAGGTCVPWRWAGYFGLEIAHLSIATLGNLLIEAKPFIFSRELKDLSNA